MGFKNINEGQKKPEQEVELVVNKTIEIIIKSLKNAVEKQVKNLSSDMKNKPYCLKDWMQDILLVDNKSKDMKTFEIKIKALELNISNDDKNFIKNNIDLIPINVK